MNKINYKVKLEPQLTETSCGPACLHAIYDYLGLRIAHQDLVERIEEVDGGGTLGVNLAIDAIRNGFEAKIYTHNLRVFDPTWFKLSPAKLRQKLIIQSQKKPQGRIIGASKLYSEFLGMGGSILFEKLTPRFLYNLLKAEGPVICGLSGTYLYKCERELNTAKCEYNDVLGYPQGHFVVLNGISSQLKTVQLTDPFLKNPTNKGQKYSIDVHDFIHSILVGVITYDANLIAISKRN